MMLQIWRIIRLPDIMEDEVQPVIAVSNCFKGECILMIWLPLI